ncbi:porin [Paucibacter sp. R3-3]|uniref:Porin n=1 Tax=Roseateles agri TaxID=3098619 RepID=A0ABU5DK01_9BURK|nr:porin [Paucibacter sp. R3-3]MDY0746058.1 porin [Paucibacter sp. R3-3]
MRNFVRPATAVACACAALFSSAPVRAQGKIEIYGVLDEGIEHVNNIGKARASSWRSSAGYLATSFWGVRGEEDLGGGMKAFFDLESGFGLDTGATALSRQWGRGAFVGLSGDFGKVTLGRQYTMRFYAQQPLNMFGTGSQSLGIFDNGFTNPRVDNAISYMLNKGGFQGGVELSFGRDSQNGGTNAAANCPGETIPSKECREYSWVLNYSDKNWGVVSSFERDYGGMVGTFAGLTSPDLSDSRLNLGAWYRFGETKISAGLIKRDQEGLAIPKSNLYFMMASTPLTHAITLTAQLAHQKYENSANKASQFALRGLYAFSKKTRVYLTASYVRNDGALSLPATTAQPATTPLPGSSQLAITTGILLAF